MGNIFGETKTMTCGMEATVIADRGSKDIDIQFADGTIVEHRTRATFLKGSIGNPTIGTRFSSRHSIVGQEKIMNCGLKAVVIADRGAQDIDIQLENGEIIYNRCRGDFNRGQIASSYLGRTFATHKSRAENTSILGESNIMACGMKATVIEDNNSNDITVQFEDGTIIKKCRRQSFKTGMIHNPNHCPNNIVGKSVIMRNGLSATCITYRSSSDIDVRFEDGVIVSHKNRTNFLAGRIGHPAIDSYKSLRKQIVGKTLMMNCGMKCTVIADRTAQDIDVKFEDGTIVEHKTRLSFTHGAIANPLLLTNSLPEQIIYHFIKKHFSDARRSYRPQWLKNPASNTCLEIDIWIPSLKIGIEYDGSVWHKERTQRSEVKFELVQGSSHINKLITILERGAIIHESPKHINFQLNYQSIPTEYTNLFTELEVIIQQILEYLGANEEVSIDSELISQIRASGRYSTKDIEVLESIKFDPKTLIGETRMMNCCMNATIIAARSNRDIDVRFEDGTIVEHRDKYSFYRGSILNPRLGFGRKRSLAANNLGETHLMKCGLSATVIVYRKSDDIDIQFEDGIVVQHCSKHRFQTGVVSHPKLGIGFSRRKREYIGETKQMKCGQNATIIGYTTFTDITIQFEDGTIVEHAHKDSFNKGEIRNPNLSNSRKTNIVGMSRLMNCGMSATVIAYRNANDLDVQFEDGTVVEHKSKGSFQTGSIKNPNYKRPHV